MAEKAQYQTKQMALLTSYLESVKGRHVTVGEIKAYFKGQDVPMGTATIYRHLERMVEQGTVIKYVVDKTSSACFQYIGQEEKTAESGCYHCKCVGCGRLIHLQCSEVAHFSRHLAEQHGFCLDAARTVFYGLCGRCQRGGAQGSEK